MPTIRARKRRDGSVAFLAEIRIKQDGFLVHRESRTFDREALARAWAKTRERDLAKVKLKPPRPALEKQKRLSDIFKRYRIEVSEVRPMGRSKTSHIRMMEKCALARLAPEDVRSSDIIAHIRGRRQSGAGPATVNNDLVWLRVVMRYARAAWDTPFDMDVVDIATEVLRAEKLIAKSQRRSRRPSPGELDALTNHFRKRDQRTSNIPMCDIMWFAIHSARRQSEITHLLFSDNDETAQTGAVRNLKHPTDRGTCGRFKFTDGAWEIVQRQPVIEDRVFPFDARSIGSAFRKACKLLDIEDLRFHDLRHEATSRLFEAGYSITEVQQFTLHDSWGTLSRYTHLRPEGVRMRRS